jgi:hypothetical protein
MDPDDRTDTGILSVFWFHMKLRYISFFREARRPLDETLLPRPALVFSRLTLSIGCRLGVCSPYPLAGHWNTSLTPLRLFLSLRPDPAPPASSACDSC